MSKMGLNHEQFAELMRQRWGKLKEQLDKFWENDDDDFQNDPTYLEAVNYFQKLQPDENVDYSSTIEYMKVHLAHLQETDETLDTKADSILRNLAGGTAIISVSALLLVKVENQKSMILAIAVLIALIPSIYYAVRAVTKASKVRKPRMSVTYEGALFAVNCAEYNAKTAQINTWLILHPMCVALYYRNVKKSESLSMSFNHYIWAIYLLCLPVVALICVLGYCLHFSR